MNPLAFQLAGKSSTSSPVTTGVLLGIVVALFLYVLFIVIREHRIARAAKKRGDDPHTGRHGNH